MTPALVTLLSDMGSATVVVVLFVALLVVPVVVLALFLAFLRAAGRKSGPPE